MVVICPLERNVSHRMTLPTTVASRMLQMEACVQSILSGSLSPAGSISAGPRLEGEGLWRGPHRSGLERYTFHFKNNKNFWREKTNLHMSLKVETQIEEQ